MSNVQYPNLGFMPSGDCHRITQYTAGGTVYAGDLVQINGSGAIVQATATSADCGVSLGYATTGQTVMVADEPSQLFEAQFLNSTSATTGSDIGAQYSAYIGAASTAYKTSGMAVDYNTKATSTSTLKLALVRYSEAANNDATAAYSRVIVRINKHQLAQGPGIVAF